MTSEGEGATRRVRPWLAALLTFLGWGVGFYYAGRRRMALWWAVASVALGVVLGMGVLAYAIHARSAAPFDALAGPWSLVDFTGWAINLSVAAVAWIVAAKATAVPKGPPARMFGYLLIFLAPILVSLVLAMAIRFTALHPFRMPAGSMQPTIGVGDYMVVSKWSYGYSRYSFAPFDGLLPRGRWRARAPERGDLVVFRPVPEPDRDFIKRLVGLPGDRIQMIDGALHINGDSVRREALGLVEFENEYGQTERVNAYRETLPNGVSYTTFDRSPRSELDNTREYVVPPGHYFMLGDDRDNSADSRVPVMVGYVPYDNLVGRVDYILRSQH